MENTREIKQFNLMQIILYHLLPGIPVLFAAIFFTNPTFGLGIPIFLSLMLIPWENITRMLAVLPFVYAVWRKKNIYIGVIAHCAVNTLSCFAFLFSML